MRQVPQGGHWITLSEITQIPLPCLQRASEGSLASRDLTSVRWGGGVGVGIVIPVLQI